ncbi:hypothetical protein ACFLWR_03385 [Chloroflexota bacterium]
MARAVIEFTENISPIMPQIYRVIEGCAYNNESHVAAFRYDDMRVIVENKKITIYGAEEKHTVERIISWFIDKINGSFQ